MSILRVNKLSSPTNQLELLNSSRLDLSGVNTGVRLPTGSTSEETNAPNGSIRFNSDDFKLKYYNNGWSDVTDVTSPYIESVGGGLIIQDNLTLSLDAASAISYPRTGTTWFDISEGTQYNGTFQGGVQFVGDNGGTIEVDGLGGHVQVGRVPRTGTSTESITFGIWVYPMSLSGNVMSMSSTLPQGSWNMPPIAADNGRFFGKMWSNQRIYSTPFTLNTWYYVTFVWNYNVDSNIRGQYLYVNGVLQGQQTGINYSASGTNNYLYLGQRNPGADNTGNFAGRYGAYHIYNFPLSQEDINQNFNLTRGRFGV